MKNINKFSSVMLNISYEQANFFNNNGYLIISNLLKQEEVAYYHNIYEDFLENKVDASLYRSDLGEHAGDKPPVASVERITQIMVPSRILPRLLEEPLHKKNIIHSTAAHRTGYGFGF